MPKKPVDYKKTIIYKIVCKDLDIKDCYVGHTTNFAKRKYNHKSNCINNELNYYVYEFIRDHGGWDNWTMIKICDHPCNTCEDACKKERECIESLNATLNKYIPGRTYKQYREDNKEKFLEYEKEYYEDNKEKIREKQKQYYEGNKDKINQKTKKYYQDNEDKLKEKKIKYKEKIKCECGCIVRKTHLKRHQQSNKHINLLKT